MNKQKTNLIPMISITVLFFMWGFITSLNDVLIPFFKNVYSLSHFEANIVQFAFFIAYFIGSIAFFLLSKKSKDPIHLFGYKKTLEIGLYIASISSLLFALSAYYQLGFGVFLISLFTLGLGLTFLQVAANPFVAVLGSPDSASSRLNLSQAFNSLGTTLGPALGGYFVFSLFDLSSKDTTALVYPYLAIGVLLVLLALFINASKIEEPIQEIESKQAKDSVFNYPFVWLGALGIFFYVGAEVAIGSNMVAFLTETTGGLLTEDKASSFLSYYWGGAMIGRFLGAVSLSKIEKAKKIIYMLLLAAISFLLIYIVNYSLHGLTFSQVWLFLVFIGLNFFFFYLGRSRPARSLAIFSLVNLALILISINLNNEFGIWAMLSIGLFNSIMWSNVFTLAIDKLKDMTAQASSILIMMILGGAILPPLQGWLADLSNIKISFFVPFLSYVYLFFYGAKGYMIGKSRLN